MSHICRNGYDLMAYVFIEFFPMGPTEGKVLDEQASRYRQPQRKHSPVQHALAFSQFGV
jgi:hypothetical protein